MTDGDVHTALIHLYRGELQRLSAYRVRLDATTNWAVGTTAAVMSFAFGSHETHHAVFAVALALNFTFMWMEARRYRIFAMILERVRALEVSFYGAVLGQPPDDDGWRANLRASLREPTPPLSRLRAAAVRLRRSYLWLVLLVYAGWAAKLAQRGDLVAAARVGPVPGVVVLVAAAALLVLLVGVALSFARHQDAG